MRLEQLDNEFEKRRLQTGLSYSLNPPASEEQIQRCEHNLGIVLPEQVKAFYTTHNGLTTKEPAICFLPLEKWERLDYARVLFALIDHRIRVGFLTGELNMANQWDIVSVDTGVVITHTMASLWSIKMWAWIDKQRPIWLSDNEIYGRENHNRAVER